MLSPELEAKALLGKSISDVYGRSLGRIIGVNRNQFGEMEGLEVESPGGNVIDIPSKSIMLTPKIVTATPEWKVDAHELTGEIVTVKMWIVKYTRSFWKLKGRVTCQRSNKPRPSLEHSVLSLNGQTIS